MPVRINSAGIFVLPATTASGPPSHHIAPESLAALPAAPGVYFFRDRRRRPLYIGKSVDIRSRVAAHLRNAGEAALLAESRSVDFIETAGEIGALLQESCLVKQWQPRFNCMLLTAGEPWVVASARGELALRVMRASDAQASRLRAHGLFASRSGAERALAQLLQQARLCPGLSGLEAIIAGRGCFARQLGQCDGACAGHEPIANYRRRRSRALTALQARAWPYPGAIGIVEQRAGIRQVHVIDRWAYCGSLGSGAGCRTSAGGFDADVYRIVAARLQRNELDVLLLDAPAS